MVKKLTQQQQAALDWVAETDERYRLAKMRARVEIKRLIEERIEQHAAARVEAVVQAVNAGVPKSRVGREGLHTTSPNTVYDIMTGYEELMELTGVELAAKPVEKYSWAKIQYHPATDKPFTFLLVDGDDHYTETTDEHMNGEGYLFFKPQNRWETLWDTPEHVKAWAAENPPAEEEA